MPNQVAIQMRVVLSQMVNNVAEQSFLSRCTVGEIFSDRVHVDLKILHKFLTL